MAFDVITPARLGQAAISTTPTVDTLYTVPALTRALLKSIEIANTTASPGRIMMILLSSLEKPRRRPDSASTGSGFEARLRQCRAGQRLGDLNLKARAYWPRALALRQG